MACKGSKSTKPKKNRRNNMLKFLAKVFASKIGKIPANRIDRDSWVIDTDIEPHGYGNVSNAFEEVFENAKD